MSVRLETLCAAATASRGRWLVIQSMKMANRYALVLAVLGLVKVCPQSVQRHRCFPLDVVPIFVAVCSHAGHRGLLCFLFLC